MNYPKGIHYVNVERSLGKYKFLHDPAIIVHKKQLISAWYNCPQEEISGESRINARRSDDGVITWSEVETIAQDTNNSGIYYVPAQLLSFKNELFSFVGRMTGHDRIVNTVMYKYNDSTKHWNEIGAIADLFLPNCTPQKLENGNWIMAGRVALALGEIPLTPAVLISNGDDIKSSWRVVKLQPDKFRKDQYPETTVITDGNTLYAFTRVDSRKYIPRFYISKDFGETWTQIENHNFRAVSSKLYAGTLSTGQKYAVFNYPMSGEINARSVLALSLSSASEVGLKFSRILKIRSSRIPDSPTDSHYPCALEYDGKLYVIYTAEFAGEKKRQCELAIIPIESLTF
ncbi:MAG: sialidase family protein [Ginsengibacter sp.]